MINYRPEKIGGMKLAVKVPSKIILDKSKSKKRVIHDVAMSLCENQLGKICFTQNQLMELCGYQYRNAQATSVSFAELTEALKQEGYIAYDKLHGNSKLVAADKLKSMENPNHYAIIYPVDFASIASFRSALDHKASNKITQTDLMLVLSYIRLRMFRSSNGSIYCADYINNIAESIGETVWMVDNCVSILNSLGIIYSESLAKYQLDGQWHTAKTIFVNVSDPNGGNNENDYDCKKEMERAKKCFYNQTKEHKD